MQERYPAAEFIVCGVSMSGYVGLALAHEMPDMFAKLVIQVPAAYSSAAHDLKFDASFTEELRRPNSWTDSPSFEWWDEFAGPKMLIACEKDMTIPREIIDRYREIGERASNFTYKEIAGAPHNIWRATEDRERIISEGYEALRNFLLF
jgi:pimeloyl-ACP methyl ester carboxylesterase